MSAPSTQPAAPPPSEDVPSSNTPAIICIGMAGSGKTTFMQRINAYLHQKKTPPYVLNLDPAVLKTPYPTNIDIRDSVDYRKVMEKYNLGPNGAIVTSLNLFSTKIDQVLNIVQKRAQQVDHIIIDTPGQIECFVWSASGSIITDSFASAFPTVIAYIVDTPRSSSPATFMSNMLYACSILYKTKLPMIIVFNKTDVKDAAFAKEWMTNFEAFQNALYQNEDLNGDSENTSGYMGSLINSMSLMLEEFYNHLDVVSVSALTGDGIDDFFVAVDKKVEEFNKDYKVERDAMLKKREEEAAKRKTKDLTRLMKDIGIKDKKKGEKKETGLQVDALSDVESDDEDENRNKANDEDDEYAGQLDPDQYFRSDRENHLIDEEDDREKTEESLQARYEAALRNAKNDDEREKLQEFMQNLN